MNATVRKLVLSVLFVLTVYGANWALEKWGIIELPIIGWEAPAGVAFAGLAFGLRDAIRESGGSWRLWVIGAIAAGAILSYVVSDGVTIPGGKLSIAAASGIAFGLSELLDAACYELERRHSWVRAVVASNIVGAIVDTVLFLWLAFGALDTAGGQIVGKVLMVLPALGIVAAVRRSRAT